MERSEERAQSNTIAVVIIFVLALTSALLIVGIGSMTLEESKDVAETGKNVRSMTELDTQASLVALEGGDSTTMDLDVRGGNTEVRKTGQMHIVLDGKQLRDVSLGAVVYTNGNQEVAYQGGGVWRRNTEADNSVMVSPPEVHYESGTLTLPLIKIAQGDRRVSTVRVEKISTTKVYPDGTGKQNPIPRGKELTINVTSEYYRGWATYFEDRIGGDVTVYPDDEKVSVRLVSPVSDFNLGAGLISVGTSDLIELKGRGANPPFVDSYNSSTGPYSTSKSKNGTVRGSGGVKLSGNSFINGSVNTSGTVFLDGGGTVIRGDVWHDGLDNNGGTITGETAKNGSGVDIPPIDATVTNRVNQICSSGAPEPDVGSTNHAGDYCVRGDLHLKKDETMTFDLSDGNANVSVKGDITLEQGATIQVKNTSGNTVKFWLGGDDIVMKKDSTVTVPQDKSTGLHIYGPSNTDVRMSKSQFVGLIFAPGEPGDSGELHMSSSSNIYGSAVVGGVFMTSGSAVHYDQALGGFSFERTGTPASSLSYFYVTVNEVRVGEP